MTNTLFHMWEPKRKEIIENHLFYIEQAKQRLLSQFNDIESEAYAFGDSKLEEFAAYYNPEADNGSELQEAAHDQMCEHYQMLEEMLNRTRFSVIAGMFHEWEKKLKDWIAKEINHWHRGTEVKRKIWKTSFIEIIDFLEAFDWPIRSKNYFLALDRCRLVVNAYKHGDGDAFKQIKSAHPEFIETFETTNSSYIEYADHTALKVEDAHIEEFSNAIMDFWKDVPEYVCGEQILKVPKWFDNAYDKDQVNKSKKAAT